MRAQPRYGWARRALTLTGASLAMLLLVAAPVGAGVTGDCSGSATIDGVVRAPSAFSITFACPPSITATQEFVVPRSIPMTFAIFLTSCFRQACAARSGAVADPRHVCKLHYVNNATYDLGRYRNADPPLQQLDLP